MLQGCSIRPPAVWRSPYGTVLPPDHDGWSFRGLGPHQTLSPEFPIQAGWACPLVTVRGAIWQKGRRLGLFQGVNGGWPRGPLLLKRSRGGVSLLASKQPCLSISVSSCASCQGCTRSQFHNVHNQVPGSSMSYSHQAGRGSVAHIWVNPLSGENGMINGDSHLLSRSSDFSLTTGRGGGRRDGSHDNCISTTAFNNIFGIKTNILSIKACWKCNMVSSKRKSTR